MPRGGAGAGRLVGPHLSPSCPPFPAEGDGGHGRPGTVVNCYLIGQCGQLQRPLPLPSPERSHRVRGGARGGTVAGGGPRWWWWGVPCLQPPPLCRLSTSLCSLKYLIHVAIPWTSQAGWLRRWPSWSTRRPGGLSRYVGQGPVYISAPRGFSPRLSLPPGWAVTSLGGQMCRFVLAFVA